MHATREQTAALGRLHKRAEYLKVQAAGLKWVSKSVIVQAAPNGLDIARFGLTVTRKTSNSAVFRNRIRRRLNAAASDVLPQQALPGYDYVLIGRAETATRAYEELTSDLSWCLKRLGCQR